MSAAPTYPDRLHPFHRALPIANALDRLNGNNAHEAMLIAIGDEATGGLSTLGFRHDLIAHVRNAEEELATQQKDDWLEAHGWHRSDDCPDFAGYSAGVDAAEQWIADVVAALNRFGMWWTGVGIVAAEPTPHPAMYARQGVALVGAGA